MVHSASILVDRIAAVVRGRLPSGVTPAYLDGFLLRHRATLVAVLERQLVARAGSKETPDLWSSSARRKANLAAMQLAARKRPEEMSEADKRVLASYSGWGGLSIEAVSSQFPVGFPVPESRGLIHEYYTPTKVAREVARVIRPLVGGLPKSDGTLLALEPSAGIGRFVVAASGPGFEGLRWQVIEWSELSSRMLQALRPDLAVYQGPFERWVREQGPAYAGRFGLVLANPPYGTRGASVTEDPDRSYREKAAYAYFLRRGLDLLAPNGLGVYLVPGGFLTGQSAGALALREKVLLRHHLSAAYRLPSALFPGAMLVTDLLFFRSRGGALAEVDAADSFIVEGRYFREQPEHILGTETGRDAGRIDVVAVWRFDRFARDTRHLLVSMEEFRQLGVQFVSLREQVDTSTPIGKAMFVIISAISELERDLIRERVVAGVRRAQASGKHCGRPKVEMDLRPALALLREGRSLKEVSSILAVSRATLRRRLQEQGLWPCPSSEAA